jgi:hypothetical protein
VPRKPLPTTTSTNPVCHSAVPFISRVPPSDDTPRCRSSSASHRPRLGSRPPRCERVPVQTRCKKRPRLSPVIKIGGARAQSCPTASPLAGKDRQMSRRFHREVVGAAQIHATGPRDTYVLSHHYLFLPLSIYTTKQIPSFRSSIQCDGFLLVFLSQAGYLTVLTGRHNPNRDQAEPIHPPSRQLPRRTGGFPACCCCTYLPRHGVRAGCGATKARTLMRITIIQGEVVQYHPVHETCSDALVVAP